MRSWGDPVAARADGGAYIEFDRTHYLPGETATGEAYVYLLKPQQGRLERGPFYAYLVTTNRSFPQVGKPIPAGAIRVGTFEIEQSRPKWFELTVSFTVPDVAGDGYTVAMCNDPCTVQGFKESIIGYLSVVQTTREATLLTQNQRLFNRIYTLRRAGKKQDKAFTELEGQFDALDPGALVDGEPDERDGGSARRRTCGGEQRPRACAEAPARAHDRDRPGARALRALGVDRRPEATRRLSTRPSGNPPGAAPSRAATGSADPMRELVEPRSHAMSSRSMRR